jgi:hypothetical protein
VTQATARSQLGEKIDVIEGAYEFFLAYAAQGVSRESQESKIPAQLRRHLEGMEEALASLGPLLRELVAEEDLSSAVQLEGFRGVVEADAAAAGSALALVRAQSFVSSQLVDNLNASVHVRALLTDLFLLDELLSLGVDQATAPQAPA